jgi:hypothetical protein
MRKTLLGLWSDPWLIIVLAVWSLAAIAADAPAPNMPATNSGAQPPAAAKCQEALVNPVSGFAECVKPRGAPVAPPPRRPDAVPEASRAPADPAR